MEYQFGDFRVEVDEEATRDWYEKAEEWDCTCGHCRNFVLLAEERKLPEEMLAILDRFGIPPKKANYVCEYNEKEDKLFYQVCYRLKGKILNKAEGLVDIGNISLTCGPVGVPGVYVPGTAEDFPEPYFDLDFGILLPWIDGIPLWSHEIILSSDLEEDTSELESLLRRVIPAALSLEGVTAPWEVDVLLTDDAGIHAINLAERGVDAPTDVLSFPMFDLKPGDKPSAADADPGTHLIPLGDMVLNMDRVRSQGEEYGHGPRRECAYLAVHSILHLLGYDHMDDGPMKAQMREREEFILDKLGITRG